MFTPLASMPGPQAAQVQGVRARLTRKADATGLAARRSQLVFIGYHVNRGKVAALLSEHTGTAWR